MYKDILEDVIGIPSPSGRENKFVDYIYSKLNTGNASISVDDLKNIVIEFNNHAFYTVSFVTHIDQVAFVITNILDYKARFISLSRSKDEELLNQMVLFPKGESGIIKKDDSLYVDISGAKSIKVGDFFTFYPHYIAQNDYVFGTGLDNKMACALMLDNIESLSEYSNINIRCIFSTQEEVGARGIKKISNDGEGLIVNIDATPCRDCYKNTSVEMGNGAAIKVCDSGNIIDSEMVNLITSIATENETLYQLEIIDRGSTDLAGFENRQQYSNMISLGIPCSYGHNLIEKMNFNDVDAVNVLIKGICNHYSLLRV